MKPFNTMRLQIESKSTNESFARVAVAAFVSQLDPTMEEITEIKTTVSEALTNSIVHGYQNQIGYIYLTAKLYSDGKVQIVIRDKGVGIDNIKQAMEPLFTTSTTGERSGMGFTIMETFCDKIRVTSKSGKGCRVVMEKKLHTKYED